MTNLIINSDVICEIALTIVTTSSFLYLFAVFSVYELLTHFQRPSSHYFLTPVIYCAFRFAFYLPFEFCFVAFSTHLVFNTTCFVSSICICDFFFIFFIMSCYVPPMYIWYQFLFSLNICSFCFCSWPLGCWVNTSASLNNNNNNNNNNGLGLVSYLLVIYYQNV